MNTYMAQEGQSHKNTCTPMELESYPKRYCRKLKEYCQLFQGNMIQSEWVLGVGCIHIVYYQKLTIP